MGTSCEYGDLPGTGPTRMPKEGELAQVRKIAQPQQQSRLPRQSTLCAQHIATSILDAAWQPRRDLASGLPPQDIPDPSSRPSLAGSQGWARANVTVSRTGVTFPDERGHMSTDTGCYARNTESSDRNTTAGVIAAAAFTGPLTYARAYAKCFPKSSACTQSPLWGQSHYNPFITSGETEAPSSLETR